MFFLALAKTTSPALAIQLQIPLYHSTTLFGGEESLLRGEESLLILLVAAERINTHELGLVA